MSDFFRALEAGEPEEIRVLLERDRDLASGRHASGQSAILFAAYRGRTDAVRVLREYGARLDVWDAAAVGDLDRLRSLLAESGTDVDGLSGDGWTPLHLAAFFGRTEAAELLLTAGANPVSWSANGIRNTPLHAALAGSRSVDLVRRLLDSGADPNAVAEGGYTPLHLAASRGDLELIDILLRAGAGFTRTAEGMTPAEIARERGHPEAEEHLRRAERS